MGGKLDFELQIGSTTIFKKSRDYKDVTFMDNTGFLEGDGNGKGDKNNIDPNKVIFYKEFTTEFPWDYSTNNVWAVISNGASGSVDDKKVTELEGNSGQYVIKFPEKGDVPQMIAFDTTKEWYPERVSIKSRSNSWWGK